MTATESSGDTLRDSLERFTEICVNVEEEATNIFKK